MAAASAAAASALLAGPALTVFVLVLAATGPVVGLWALRGRGDRRFEAALPALLESVASTLRAGPSMLQALASTAAATPGLLGIELSAVVAVVDQGSSMQGELDRWSRRRPVAGLRLAATALALGADTGGPQARPSTPSPRPCAIGRRPAARRWPSPARPGLRRR
ncbi:MAG: hypothetical protein WKF43_01670 [Acidimicrobiales bacterium]